MNENTENMDQELPEFDLEDILNEFHEEPQTAEPNPGNGEEPPSELQEEAQEAALPDLTPELPDITPELANLSPELPELSPETPELSPELPELSPETPEPSADQPEQEGDTIPYSSIPQSPEDAPASDDPQPTEEPAAPAKQTGPAFAVEEEFIPSPALFASHSRLKELKKQLISGPEKEYYTLSETGTAKLQIALVVCILLTALSAWAAVSYAMGAVPADRMKLLVFSQILCMMVSALMGVQLLMDSVMELLHGRFTINTMLLISFAACMVDGALCLKEVRVPCCAAFSLEMTLALLARLEERNTKLAQLDTMRKAVRLHGITRRKGFYNGKDGFLRVEGEVEDFMEHYQKRTAPQNAQSFYCAMSLVACGAIAVFAGLNNGAPMGIQIFAASLLVAIPATFFVSVSRPTAILQQRLHMVGAVLCGWQGVKGLKGKAMFPLYDQDLFPGGSTKLNGVKFYGDEDPVHVVSYTASLLGAVGGGLGGLFRGLMKDRGGKAYPVQNLRRYGKGGLGGEVNGVPVLLGSLNFLQDMGVEIPEGTMVNQAVYAAIDGQLSAVYAISYAKTRSATAGLVTLCGNRAVTPVLLCSDFMISESFLQAKFGIKTRRILFPDQEAAVQMRHVHPDSEAPVLALTTREDLIGPAYAVSGARALRTAANLGVAIHMLGGILGMLIMLVLAVLGNTELLIPSNILLYQLVWGIPGLLVTEWTRVV